MTFRHRVLQLFFLILGVIFVGMFIVRWLAPDSRAILWTLLCPAGTRIQIAPGEAELEPGEMVSAYEVACVGGGIRQTLSDFQLILLETGTSLGLAAVLAILFGWLTTRGKRFRSQTESPLPG
jgi:hypothetical protein